MGRSPEAREALEERLRSPPGVFRIPPGRAASRSLEALLPRLLPELCLTCSIYFINVREMYI